MYPLIYCLFFLTALSVGFGDGDLPPCPPPLSNATIEKAYAVHSTFMMVNTVQGIAPQFFESITWKVMNATLRSDVFQAFVSWCEYIYGPLEFDWTPELLRAKLEELFSASLGLHTGEVVCAVWAGAFSQNLTGQLSIPREFYSFYSRNWTRWSASYNCNVTCTNPANSTVLNDTSNTTTTTTTTPKPSFWNFLKSLG